MKKNPNLDQVDWSKINQILNQSERAILNRLKADLITIYQDLSDRQFGHCSELESRRLELLKAYSEAFPVLLE